ncbi:hypothetical protein AwPolaro_05960 [Polaromonas sp.]|nr:hypothetical protein AwPolaro_05960 [Polaromonas sp.]
MKHNFEFRRLPTLARCVALSLVVFSLVPLAQAQKAQETASDDNSPSQSPSNTLKIGVIGPFSGHSAGFGQPMANGVQLAVNEINAVGGYFGQPLEIVLKDDQSDAALGLKFSQELIDEKVLATIGFCNTGVASQSLELYQSNQIPLIISCASGSRLTTTYPAAESYIFRVAATDSVQSTFIVQDILARGWDKVAIFADTSSYGEGGLKDVENALAEAKQKPVYVARFPLGVKSLSAELTAARAAGANVIFSYSLGGENAVTALGRQAMGWKVPQVGPATMSVPSYIKAGKEAVDGSLTAQSFIAEPSNQRRSAFLSAYSRLFKVDKIASPMVAAQSYDSTYLLMYALLGIRDGKFTGPAIKAALENQRRTYYGVVATYEQAFSKQEKDAITSRMMVMGMLKNGAVTFAYPEDATRNLFVQRKK